MGVITIPQAGAADTPIVSGLRCYNANGWSASKIIYESSQWYGINPYVILATLQKEQSLVTTATLNQYGLDWAMGYGVPDSGSRDYSRQGFATQVDWGAWQLAYNKYNAINNTSKVAPYYVGNTITIDGVATRLNNGATASLYRYTPHFHGNQNFRIIMNLFTDPDVAWNASSIIQDSIFSNQTTLTEQQIQSFLVSRGSYLATYKETKNIVVGPDSYRCPAINLIPVYRFRNVKGFYFYTISEAEKNNIIAKWPNTYKYEGVNYNLNYTSGRNTTPLYRFYNYSNGSHLFTASEVEKNNIISKLGYRFKFEGIAWYVGMSSYNAFPVYRFRNINGTYFYTANEAEKNNIITKLSATYKLEGINYYIPY